MALDVVLEVLLGWKFASSVPDREVVVFDVVVVFLGLRLSIIEGDNEEIRLKFFDGLALHDDRWDHLILTRLSQNHLLA